MSDGAVPSADAAFKQWALVRSVMPRGRLSDISIQKYRTIWDIWTRHLDSTATPWHQAEAGHVREFLLHVAPRRKADAAATRQVSPVTQARYWKLLQSIYSHAAAMSWIAYSPITIEAKVAHSEARDSLVFNKLDWAVLLGSLPAPPLSLSHWAEVRDRALLLLMMQCALTVGELKALRLDDVFSPQWVQNGHWQLQPLPETQPPVDVQLEIRGPRADQNRSLHVPALTAGALHDYLALRVQMPQDNPLVFVRQRGGQLSSAYKSATLASKSLYVMTAAFVRRVLGGRHEQLAHAGPMSLRSSCIVRWLDAGLPDAKVLRDAGLKDPQALQRLRKHVVPDKVTQIV